MHKSEIIANVKLSNTNWKSKNQKQKKIERLIKRKKVLTVEEVWQSKGSIQMVMLKLIGGIKKLKKR
jgi:phage repressor protein C with HTH and peptisase S24 domain